MVFLIIEKSKVLLSLNVFFLLVLLFSLLWLLSVSDFLSLLGTCSTDMFISERTMSSFDSFFLFFNLGTYDRMCLRFKCNTSPTVATTTRNMITDMIELEFLLLFFSGFFQTKQNKKKYFSFSFEFPKTYFGDYYIVTMASGLSSFSWVLHSMLFELPASKSRTPRGNTSYA